MDLTSTTVTPLALKATEFGKITQIKGHYTVQGHSLLLISVPVKSPTQLPVCK